MALLLRERAVLKEPTKKLLQKERVPLALGVHKVVHIASELIVEEIACQRARGPGVKRAKQQWTQYASAVELDQSGSQRLIVGGLALTVRTDQEDWCALRR